MHVFWSVVQTIRRVGRPGILSFLRDPDDPNDHFIRDLVTKPVYNLVRAIFISVALHSMLIFVNLTLPLHVIQLIQDRGKNKIQKIISTFIILSIMIVFNEKSIREFLQTGFFRSDRVQDFTVQFPILRGIHRSNIIRTADQLLCAIIVQIRQAQGRGHVLDPRVVRVHRRITGNNSVLVAYSRQQCRAER